MALTRMMAAAMLVLPVAAQAADGGAVARVGSYDDAVVAVMKAGLPMGPRVARFQSIVESYYDMPGIAAAVVGPAWGATPAATRTQMTAALARHSAIALARNFKSYGGERFTVDPAAQVRGDSTIVKLVIAGKGSSDTLYFRMRQAGAAWKIVDVISGGVSQLAVQRADLQSTIAAGGVAGAVSKLGQIDAKAVG